MKTSQAFGVGDSQKSNRVEEITELVGLLYSKAKELCDDQNLSPEEQIFVSFLERESMPELRKTKNFFKSYQALAESGRYFESDEIGVDWEVVVEERFSPFAALIGQQLVTPEDQAKLMYSFKTEEWDEDLFQKGLFNVSKEFTKFEKFELPDVFKAIWGLCNKVRKDDEERYKVTRSKFEKWTEQNNVRYEVETEQVYIWEV